MKYIKRYNEDLEWEFDEEEFNGFDTIPHNYIDYKDELIGRRVKINKKSEYYYGDYNSNNPRDKIGIIKDISPREKLGIRVSWGKGKLNVYSEKDLDLV